MTIDSGEVIEEIGITTPAGRLRGRGSKAGCVFAGIPFAEPPVGSLRFAPPEPARPWSGSRPALSFPPAPAQPAGMVESSEDCLYLNVWTPSLTDSLPVVVWVYGGGFEGGSASPPLTDGASLARGLNAVVVAPNYRVGALGFLDTEIGANVGLQDVIAALAWLHCSVSAFGGNPDAVTLMGQSAGAFVIGALLAAPTAQGLFQRAILQSGSTGRVFSPEVAEAIRASLGARLGTTSVEEMQSLRVAAIIEAQAAVIDHDIGHRNLPGGRSWGTVLDGHVLPHDPQEVVEQGGAAGIPLLVSTTRDELQFFEVSQAAGFAPENEAVLLEEMVRAGVEDPGGLLRAYKEEVPAAPLARLRSRFLTDYIYRWPAQRLARAQAQSGGIAYLAEFTASPFGDTLGACHGSDLVYLFDSIGPFAAPDTPENTDLRAEIYASWRRFVHTGAADWSPVQGGGVAPVSRVFGPART